METINKLKKYGIGIITVISFLGILMIYPFLPETIPTHWNLNWEVNGIGPKVTILLLGALPFLVLVLLKYLPKFDPRRENYKKHEKAYEIVSNVLAVFLLLMNWITVAAALKIHLPIKNIFMGTFGLCFLIIGNYLPKFKSNYFVGIRNPWALSDETVWRKTHKAGGYVFLITGLLLFISAFLQLVIFYAVSFCFLIIGIVAINVYSYLLYKKGKD